MCLSLPGVRVVLYSGHLSWIFLCTSKGNAQVRIIFVFRFVISFSELRFPFNWSLMQIIAGGGGGGSKLSCWV